MNQVTILGAGQLGSVIAKLLHHSGDYAVQVNDIGNTVLFPFVIYSVLVQ